MTGNCIDTCCTPRADKPPLTLPAGKIAAGVYENVTVEINAEGKVVRLEPSARYTVRGCDRCART